MDSRASEVIKNIPDYDKFMELTVEISKLQYKKLSLETLIKSKEADNFKTVSTDERFFQNGKPPSSTFIENAYKFSGIDGSLIPLRLELAEVTAKLEQKRLEMDVYKTMVDIWRTLSSTERASSI